MTTGDQQDNANRITSTLPQGWFANLFDPTKGTATGKLGVVLSGPAAVFTWIYNFILYVAAQTRRVTTSDGFLDLGLFDFFGARIKRRPSQKDDSVRTMWEKEVLRRRNTRFAVQQAIENLTGSPARIFEAFNPQDTGGFGNQWALNEPSSAFGSSNYPYTMFITAVEPSGTGIPNLSGLNDSYGGLGAGQFALADSFLITGSVTNQDIYDMINATRSAGITCWVNIGPALLQAGLVDTGEPGGDLTPIPPADRLDSTFVLNTSILS